MFGSEDVYMSLPVAPGSLVDQFSVGAIEWIVILVVLAALFLLGPKKIPELARSLGRALGEFRRGKLELDRELSREMAATDTEPGGSKVSAAARQLGVDTAGRRDAELKIEIARKIDKAPDTTVAEVARTLGVWESGRDPSRLRESIIKSLGV